MNWVAAYSAASGFAVGFLAAWFVAWWHERQRAASHLRGMLFRIGKDLYHSNAQPFNILDPIYLDLMDAIWSYHRFSFPWKRKAFLAAGFDLIGHNPKTRHRHCHAYPDRQKAYDLTEKLLGFVGCPYETYTPAPTPKE